eukprot:508968_1
MLSSLLATFMVTAHSTTLLDFRCNAGDTCEDMMEFLNEENEKQPNPIPPMATQFLKPVCNTEDGYCSIDCGGSRGELFCVLVQELVPEGQIIVNASKLYCDPDNSWCAVDLTCTADIDCTSRLPEHRCSSSGACIPSSATECKDNSDCKQDGFGYCDTRTYSGVAVSFCVAPPITIETTLPPTQAPSGIVIKGECLASNKTQALCTAAYAQVAHDCEALCNDKDLFIEIWDICLFDACASCDLDSMADECVPSLYPYCDSLCKDRIVTTNEPSKYPSVDPTVDRTKYPSKYPSMYDKSSSDDSDCVWVCKSDSRESKSGSKSSSSESASDSGDAQKSQSNARDLDANEYEENETMQTAVDSAKIINVAVGGIALCIGIVIGLVISRCCFYAKNPHNYRFGRLKSVDVSLEEEDADVEDENECTVMMSNTRGNTVS